MATIGSLAVNVVANTEPLTKGMNKARKQVKGFGKDVEKSSFSLRKFATGMAAAAGIAGTLRFVRSQMLAIDSISKTSEKLGISTEMLSAYQHAAKLSGIESNTFNTALQRMVRRLAEVEATGKGVALKAIDAMGLSIKDLAGLSPDQQLAKIADGMKGLDTQGQKVLQAFALFDTEGVAMVNMLREGSKGLDMMAQDAAKLGLVIDSATVPQIIEANDALVRMSASMEGVGRQLAITFADPVSTLADAATSVIGSFNRVQIILLKIQRGAAQVFDTIGKKIDAILEKVPLLNYEASKDDSALTAIIQTADAKIREMESRIANAGKALGENAADSMAAKSKKGGLFGIGGLGKLNTTKLLGEAIAKAQNKAQLIGVNAKLQSGLAGKSIGNIILDDILKLNKKGEEEEEKRTPRKVIQGELQALERGTAAAFSATRKQPIQDVAKNTKASVDLQKTANKTLTDIASNLLLVPANLGA